MNAIELTNVSYTYSPDTPFKKLALDNVSLSIRANAITGLMGHTGSGKSTLVQLINGLLKPDEGTVKVLGKDIWENPKDIHKLRFKVGLVFQYPEYQLFEETVKRDIAFGPSNMKLPEEEINNRVKIAAELCGIENSVLDKSPFDLSGGQKRRVAIAGVMAMMPDILILDEPAAGLDPRGREEILCGISEFRKEHNSTVIIVSHSMEDMAKYSDDIVVMKNSGICVSGSKEEIFKKSELLSSVGLDVPTITKLSSELASMGIPLDGGHYSVESCVSALSELLKNR